MAFLKTVMAMESEADALNQLTSDDLEGKVGHSLNPRKKMYINEGVKRKRQDDSNFCEFVV